MKKDNLRDLKETKKLFGRTPLIFCAIIIFFHNKNIIEARTALSSLPIGEIECRQDKADNELCYVEISRINNERFWELGEALTKMFSYVDDYLTQICKIIYKYNGTVKLDVAFYHYKTFPSLVIEGENMRKIRMLEADISIDAY